jgi:hypothetical protein
MSPRTRKLTLVLHLSSSVGWFGAVAAYTALDLTVATSSDPAEIRGAWIAMGMITSAVIVPFAVMSVLTGIVVSVGTKWGLFRHWWVVISLVLTASALVVLLVETRIIAEAAGVAADPTASTVQIQLLPTTLPHSLGGLVVLGLVQILNVYKPQGLTPYGWRKQQAERSTSRD